MNKNILMSLLMLLTTAFFFTACSDNDDPAVVTTTQSVTLQMPLNLDNATLSNAVITLTNVQTGKAYTISNLVKGTDNTYTGSAEVPVGTYNVSAEGTINYAIEGVNSTSSVKATSEGVAVKEGTTANAVSLVLNTYNSKEGFVISEIYFTGSATPEGKQYGSDQYIIITNNTDRTLYADSIAVLESEFLTSTKRDYTPDLMEKAMAVHAVYMIPGTGKSVPVEAGKSLLLALNAKNHTEIYTTAYDLSGANYEFYDESSNQTVVDDDNTNIPNLDKWYCYTKTIFGFHNRSFCAYAIAKMQGSKENFLSNNVYKASYKFVFDNFSKDMTTETYMIPNSWIIDAVNVCTQDSYQWGVVSSTLDAGWTYAATSSSDKTRYNHSVIRKSENGKYVDTNNSTNDFTPRATPSLAK